MLAETCQPCPFHLLGIIGVNNSYVSALTEIPAHTKTSIKHNSAHTTLTTRIPIP